MNKRGFFLLLPLCVGFMYCSVIGQQDIDPKAKEATILKTIFQAKQQFHLQPVAVDDKFAAQVFDDYVKYLDFGKRFLTQKDVDALASSKLQIDDEALVGKVDFFEKSLPLIEQGILKSKAYFNEYIEQDIDLNKKESLELDSDKKKYAKDDKELRDYWRKLVQYEYVSRLYDDEKENEKAEKKKTQAELLKDIKKEIKDNYESYFERLAALRRSDRFEMYVNAMAHLNDPHTDYLNPKEKEDFNINMSGKLEGIGARLQTEREYTKVVSIVPGGPAWKQKELEVNDIITAVQQKNAEPVDIKGMRIDDVVKMIRGKKGTDVILSVKKKDGITKSITIERDEVIMDEGYAKSAILEIPGIADKVGYIYLPRFYADFDDANGPSAAKDIEYHIKRLNQQGITSLILDIRNNGGGSLNEVVDMAGLFIKDGPIVQVKGRDNKYPYYDKDPNVKFTGPMAILVNSNSASASEILAAALQDYKRAIVVGGNATFGKGSVQRFFPLDRFVNSPYAPLGDLKITVQKYYRVNGGSVQLDGVTPDIILPDNFSYILNGEKEYGHPLPNTTIEPMQYKQDVFVVNDLEKLKTLSKERVQADSQFTMIDQNAKRFKALRDNSSTPINKSDYAKYQKAREDEAKQYENIMKQEIPNFNASLINADLASLGKQAEAFEHDTARIARNEDFLKNIKKDIYIYETIKVLKDAQNLK